MKNLKSNLFGCSSVSLVGVRPGKTFGFNFAYFVRDMKCDGLILGNNLFPNYSVIQKNFSRPFSTFDTSDKEKFWYDSDDFVFEFDNDDNLLLFLPCIYTESLDLNKIDIENTPDIPFIIAATKLFIYLNNKFGDDYLFNLEFSLFLNTNDKSKELSYHLSPTYIGKSEDPVPITIGAKILHENFKLRGYFKYYETLIDFKNSPISWFIITNESFINLIKATIDINQNLDEDGFIEHRKNVLLKINRIKKVQQEITENTNKFSINDLGKRRFSTSSTPSYNINKFNSTGLNPWFIAGFSDAEATFTISISKDNRERKTTRRLLNNMDREIYSIHPSFAISLNSKDYDIVNKIHSYFGVGKIKDDLSNNAVVFYVNSIEDLLKIIIPFFENNTLTTQKKADFILFKSAVELINKGEHLTNEGIKNLVNIKASMNKGLSDKLKKSFPDFIPAIRPIVSDQEIKDANWLAGFTSGEGSFYIRIKKAETEKSINRVSFFFSIVQSNRDSLLISNISKYLNCGTIHANTKYTQFRVTKFENIDEKIIPFFKKYPLQGLKKLNFDDFCVVMEMVKSKVHLTSEGFEKIEKIISGMNLKRK